MPQTLESLSFNTLTPIEFRSMAVNTSSLEEEEPENFVLYYPGLGYAKLDEVLPMDSDSRISLDDYDPPVPLLHAPTYYTVPSLAENTTQAIDQSWWDRTVERLFGAVTFR